MTSSSARSMAAKRTRERQARAEAINAAASLPPEQRPIHLADLSTRALNVLREGLRQHSSTTVAAAQTVWSGLTDAEKAGLPSCGPKTAAELDAYFASI